MKSSRPRRLTQKTRVSRSIQRRRLLRPGSRVLVAGGAGFIGSHLCRTLLAKGCRVYVVDNFTTGRLENISSFQRHRRFTFHRLDIVNPQFKKRLTTIPFDVIFHLACPTGVPNIRIYAEEMLLSCSIGTRQVLELARRHRAKVIYISSCEVYGHSTVLPQPEDVPGLVDPIGPRSPYEEGKRFSESLVVMYFRKYGLPVNIIRVFNAFGPGMSPDDQRVIPQFIRSLARGEPLRIYGNGSQTRTHLYIDDLIRGLVLVAERGRSGEVYNVGGHRQLTVKQLAESIMNIARFRTGITYQPHFIEDHARRLPALRKIRALGWKPVVPVTIGIRRTLIAHGLVAKRRTKGN